MRHLYHRHVALLFEVIDDIDHDNIYLVLEVRYLNAVLCNSNSSIFSGSMNDRIWIESGRRSSRRRM